MDDHMFHRRMDRRVELRMSSSDYAYLDHAARAAGLDVSKIIRRGGLELADRIMAEADPAEERNGST